MKILSSTAVGAVVIGLTILASPAVAQTTVTSFAPSTNTTPGVWFENDVRFGGTASVADLTGLGGNLENSQPLQVGAAKITTRLGENPDKAEVGVLDSYGTVAGILSTLQVTYSWHKATNGTQNQNAAPSLKLSFFNPACVDTTNNPGLDCFGALVYEAYQNGFGNFPALDTWNTSSVDYNSGMWWWTGGFGFSNQAGGPANRTLAQWETELTNLSSDFPGAQLVLVSIGVGSFNQGQIGYFDNVVIAGTNSNASYDFDPAPQFESLGECVSTLIADECSSLTGRARATCNHTQQMACFDIFNIQ